MKKHQTSVIIKLPKVIHKTSLSRSSIYLKMKAGTFVNPIKLGARSIGFLESDVDEWIKKRIEESRKNGGEV